MHPERRACSVGHQAHGLYASRLCELGDSRLSIQLAQSLSRYAMVGGPQHILMCKLVSPEQAAVHDAAVRRAWQLVLGVEMIDDNWERATYPLKQGGLAPGTLGTRASAAYLAALTRAMPEVLRRTAHDGAEALRRAAPALDRGITVATADVRNRGVPAGKVPFASGNGTVEPKQKDIAVVINGTVWGPSGYAGRGRVWTAPVGLWVRLGGLPSDADATRSPDRGHPLSCCSRQEAWRSGRG